MSRILNRQRQLAEQGRLRLGYTVPTTKRDGTPTTRPVRSETWIVTSHSREHVEHAANLWGGEATEWEPMGNGAKQWRVITKTNTIAAILPPGDPLSQAYEMWSKGGCQRRCNGVTEELSGSPCICLAQHGEQWYELSARQVCVSKSRLKVLLPDMPGLGSWRMETGSFYATDEIAGMVDTIRGAVGENVLVPVQLRIEPRTRVAGGETKQFVVPVVELRGVTAGALLSGAAVETGALRSANLDSRQPAALQAAAPPATDYRGLADAAPDLDTVRAIWHEAANHGHLDEDLKAYLTERGNALQAQVAAGAQGEEDSRAESRFESGASSPTSPPGPDADGVYEAEIVPPDEQAPPTPAPSTQVVDPDAIWQQVVTEAGHQGMGLSDLQDDFAASMGGLIADDAAASELQAYLEELRARRAGEQVPA